MLQEIYTIATRSVPADMYKKWWELHVYIYICIIIQYISWGDHDIIKSMHVIEVKKIIYLSLDMCVWWSEIDWVYDMNKKIDITVHVWFMICIFWEFERCV